MLDQLLDLTPEVRAARIEELAAGNAHRARALRTLVAECERAMPLFDRVATERFDALVLEPSPPLLPALLAGRYETGRELGHGGMARVYLARDRKHGRNVAIKAIRPELAASLGHDRFLREIEIAARLRHPNIVPLYDSGDINGALYFVMPFEDGPSLRDRLREGGALPIAEAVSILRDVARALGYAHEHGVVHRDVKPDNVMLSGDAAVVTDFGIAKAVSVSLTREAATTITQVGAAIGTPAYMAPEQAIGDPSTDHRADIYAFGCLAYELLGGTPPFAAGSSHEVIASHMTKTPRALTELRPDVPAAVENMVLRCLAKQPDDRPQSVRELLAALDASPANATIDGAHGMPARTRLWGPLSAVAVVIMLIGAVYALRRPPTPPPPPLTLAVLPFTNTAAEDSSINFVVDGLADEVAADLTRVPGIQIKSVAGARMYRGQLGVDVAEAGARLKAEYILTGVARQERGRWLLSANLDRVQDGASIWAETFIVNPDQQASAVSLINRSLLSSLRARFPRSVGATPTAIAAAPTTNNEAYRLYLRGQEQLKRRGTSVAESAELFRRAIHEDTLFARAYSGLSMSLALFPYFQGVPAKDINADLVRAARRALDLDSTLAQPYIALGLAHQFALQWDSAEIDFRTALQRDSRDVEALVQYARYLIFRGRVGDAMRQLALARVEDPASALVLSWVSYAYYMEGRLDSAVAESRRALENDPKNFTTVTLGALVHLGDKRLTEARALNDRSPPASPIRGYVAARLGDSAVARRELADLDRQIPQPWMSHTRRALLNLGLGDTARALASLERATSAGEIWPLMYGVGDPLYRPVERSAHFAALLRRVGLDPDAAHTRDRD
jgi:serine/threonine-protein kinase